MTTVINGTSTSASAPAVVGDDSDTGLYYPASNQVGIASGGTKAIIVAQSNVTNFYNSNNLRLYTANEGNYGFLRNSGASSSNSIELGANGVVMRVDDSYNATFFNSGAAQKTIITANNGIGIGGATPSSGTGITFPSAQDASTNANTLDDYEEGTFSFNPFFITGQSGSFTNGRNTGYYIKIGKVVHIQGWVTWSAIPASGTTFAINLPFTSISGDDPRGGFAITYSDGFVSTGYQIAARTENAASYCVLNRSTSTSLAVNSAFNQGDLSTSSGFMISGSYIANA